MKERIELGIELERLFIFEFLRKVNWERRRSRVCNQVLTLLKTTSLGIKSVEVGRSAEWSNFTRVQCVQLTIIVENDHRSIWISIKIFFYTKLATAWKFDEFSKISNYTLACFDNFKFNFTGEFAILERIVNVSHCTILLGLPLPLSFSLGSEATAAAKVRGPARALDS